MNKKDLLKEYNVLNVPGDGNCMFRSVAKGIKIYNENYKYINENVLMNQIRKESVDLIKREN